MADLVDQKSQVAIFFMCILIICTDGQTTCVKIVISKRNIKFPFLFTYSFFQAQQIILMYIMLYFYYASLICGLVLIQSVKKMLYNIYMLSYKISSISPFAL